MSAVNWTFRVISVMRILDAVVANTLIPGQFANDTNESRTFQSCRLSNSGNNPALAYACSTAAKPTYKDYLVAMKDTYPNTRVYVYNPDTDILSYTNSAAAIGQVGQKYTFIQILAELGYSVITADPLVPPLIININPTTLHLAGGPITINGSGFQDNAVVKVGLTALTNVVVSADGTKITATVPALSLGLLGVTVTNPTPNLSITVPGLLNIIL